MLWYLLSNSKHKARNIAITLAIGAAASMVVMCGMTADPPPNIPVPPGECVSVLYSDGWQDICRDE